MKGASMGSPAGTAQYAPTAAAGEWPCRPGALTLPPPWSMLRGLQGLDFRGTMGPATRLPATIAMMLALAAPSLAADTAQLKLRDDFEIGRFDPQGGLY